VAQYSLFVLKVPLNTNLPTNISAAMSYGAQNGPTTGKMGFLGLVLYWPQFRMKMRYAVKLALRCWTFFWESHLMKKCKMLAG